jgi:hypothetical protein
MGSYAVGVFGWLVLGFCWEIGPVQFVASAAFLCLQMLHRPKQPQKAPTPGYAMGMYIAMSYRRATAGRSIRSRTEAVRVATEAG